MGFFSEYKQVNKLLQQKQQVIFYAESRHYYQYYEQLITDLLANTSITICYITSDKNDPLLNQAPERMQVIYARWMLGFAFSKLRADVMIMTMPDLGNFLFKRSPGVGQYIYIFHAAVSTHQQYRRHAFFNYDTIFCTGGYQQKEIRAAERLNNLPAKNIVEYGYPLLDTIRKKTVREKKDTILIAPSWFDGCIFDTCIEELLQHLSKSSYKIVLRSHPEYEKRRKKEFKKIRQLVSNHPSMSIDDKPGLLDSITQADLLITDRSGIAFEFAFGVVKPVLFIDTALKQTNPGWKELDIEPVENSLRTKLGVTMLPSEMELVHQKINDLEKMRGTFSANMSALASYLFYNNAESYRKGWEYIAGLVK